MKEHAKSFVQSNLGAMLIALFITSPLIVWTLDRREPVTVVNYSISHPTAMPGDTIYRIITVHRNKACETDADIVLVDGAGVRWRIDEPPITTPGPIGVDDSYKVPMVIPPFAFPGPAEIRVTVTRRCNPMHGFWPLVQSYEPLKFTILKER